MAGEKAITTMSLRGASRLGKPGETECNSRGGVKI
jgi:hypothetical protein